MNNILVTGGAGFIGSNFLHHWIHNYPNDQIIVLDLLTYAGNYSTINTLINERKITFIKGDICDSDLVKNIFDKYSIEKVVHFAAESHVDRSILESGNFVNTNIVGTHVLLVAALEAWGNDFYNKHFHHISTDEVYGDLELESAPFTENTAYAPRSPYAASKASSDHLVRAFYTTYELPITISNCSNNYGPYQFPEKLIPLMLINCLEGKKLPVYGNGLNIRDWLHVDDHCTAIMKIIKLGKNGDTYNVGGENQITNIELIKKLCDLLDKKISQDMQYIEHFPNCSVSNNRKSHSLIEFVEDRLGHDSRYAIDPKKIKIELGFTPQVDFIDGISATINWYLCNEAWWRSLLQEGH